VLENQRLVDYTQVSIRKPAATTHMRNQYTLTEKKLFNIIMHQGERDDYGRTVYTMPVADLRRDLNSTTSRNKDWLRDAIRGLVTKGVEWNTLGKDKSLKNSVVDDWGISTFLSMGNIKGSSFRFSINPHMIGWIKEQRVWGRMHYMVQLRFSKTYALILYEFMITELSNFTKAGKRIKVKKGEAIDIIVPLTSLRILFGTSKTQYKEFRSFNQHVIGVALNEVNRESDIYITHKSLRTGRSVDRVSFKVVRKEHYQLLLPVTETMSEDSSSGDVDPIGDDDLLLLLKSVEIGPTVARRTMAQYPRDRIRKNIAYALTENEKGKVKKVSSYALTAIAENYAENLTTKQANAVFERLDQEAMERNLKEAASAAKDAEANLKSEFTSFRDETAKGKLDERSKTWFAKAKREFIETKLQSGIARDRYQSDGFGSPTVQALWSAFLKDRVLNDGYESDFEAYKRWKLDGMTN